VRKFRAGPFEVSFERIGRLWEAWKGWVDLGQWLDSGCWRIYP
jgi:hypothetical protein